MKFKEWLYVPWMIYAQFAIAKERKKWNNRSAQEIVDVFERDNTNYSCSYEVAKNGTRYKVEYTKLVPYTEEELLKHEAEEAERLKDFKRAERVSIELE